MSEGVRAAWIAAAASILAAVLGAILGRPVINEVLGTTDKIERLTEENQALRKENSGLKAEVAEALKRSERLPNEEGEAGGAQTDEMPLQQPINLGDLAVKIAEEKKTQILALGTSVKGAIAEKATREYVFVGNANTPILFTLEQPSNHFWAAVDIHDSRGMSLLKGEDFIRQKDEIAFTPPHDDASLVSG